MNIKEAKHIIGGLSRTEKMPWFSYSLPARTSCPGYAARCAMSPDAICNHCYATRGRYVFDKIINAQYRRLEIVRRLSVDPEACTLWLDAMKLLLDHYSKGSQKLFRWHDSGDVVTIQYMDAIASVARMCPDTIFRLPTQSLSILEEFITHDTIPENLIIQVGAPLIGDSLDDLSFLHNYPLIKAMIRGNMISFSMVTRNKTLVNCPATMNGKPHSCLLNNCFKCWKTAHKVTVYRKH